MLHALLLDDAILNHECAHAVVAYAEGASLIWINANRHTLDDNLGETAYILPDGISYEARGRAALAGVVFEPSLPSWLDREVARLQWALAGSPAYWLDAREYEVREILRREARALTALCHAVVVNGRVLSGVYAEAVLCGAVGEA